MRKHRKSVFYCFARVKSININVDDIDDIDDKCRKHSPAARVFYISLVFSNDHRVLSQCNTRLRLLYLLRIAR